MKKQLVRFYSEKLKSVPSYAVYLFFEYMEAENLKELTINEVSKEEIDSKNSITRIAFHAEYKRTKAKGGGGTHIHNRRYEWECQHSTDFSCSNQILKKFPI